VWSILAVMKYKKNVRSRSQELRRAVRAIRQTDVCGQHSVVVNLGRESAGRRGNQRTRRPRKHRGEAVTTETTTTTTTTTTTAAATTTPGRRSRNRAQSGSRRNRGGRNREARQRARASRRDRQQHQGRHWTKDAWTSVTDELGGKENSTKSWRRWD